MKIVNVPGDERLWVYQGNQRRFFYIPGGGTGGCEDVARAVLMWSLRRLGLKRKAAVAACWEMQAAFCVEFTWGRSRTVPWEITLEEVKEWLCGNASQKILLRSRVLEKGRGRRPVSCAPAGQEDRLR